MYVNLFLMLLISHNCFRRKLVTKFIHPFTYLPPSHSPTFTITNRHAGGSTHPCLLTRRDYRVTVMNQEYISPFRAEIKNAWSYTVTPPYICLPSYLINLSLCSLKQISYRPLTKSTTSADTAVYLSFDWDSVPCNGFCVSAEMSVIGRVYLPAKHLGRALPAVDNARLIV
jgi:hypothetical protein